ncbi:MAG: hypothetical protein PHP69_01570 [Candidatus Omnitrophica bacterium]|jgi:hypothetical protein|nr:hypothetical protein [Candidatus Omnitrophota bacterium]MDD5081040.1 hypothetical protein [Candidatus Omnitrophota bacterium]MDD5441014.1 hypothetical protein [Candidatus Omnitrophota bacterium]
MLEETKKYKKKRKPISENKKWITPAMLKIRLNPEQAVLSCCDNSGRAALGGTFSSRQCVGLFGGTACCYRSESGPESTAS